MRTDPADFRRLTLLIQRMLDADALCDAEGAALLTEAEAAGRSREVGDTEAARQRVEQVVRLTEDLVRNEVIVLARGTRNGTPHSCRGHHLTRGTGRAPQPPWFRRDRTVLKQRTFDA